MSLFNFLPRKRASYNKEMVESAVKSCKSTFANMDVNRFISSNDFKSSNEVEAAFFMGTFIETLGGTFSSSIITAILKDYYNIDKNNVKRLARLANNILGFKILIN